MIHSKLDLTGSPLFDTMDQYRGIGGGGGDVPFVTGAIWYQPRDVTVQMRVRERLRKDPPRDVRGGKSSNAAAKKVTSPTKKKAKKKAPQESA